MAYSDVEILRDKAGNPIPQVFDPKQNKFIALNGKYGSTDFVQLGTVTKESWSGNQNITKTFTDSMYGFAIINDGTSDLTFTINGQTFTVKVGEQFEDLFESFTQVTITTTSAYRALVRC